MSREEKNSHPTLDAEVIELLQDEPQLLAIADAVAATQRRRQRRGLRLPAAAAAAAAAAALALFFVLGDRSSLVEEALAAVGSERVLHSIIVRDIPSEQIIDLRTGDIRPVAVRVEAWSDRTSGRLRIRTARGGDVVADALTTAGEATREDGSLDPTARFFVSGYRQALESGDAQELSDDVLAIGRQSVGARVTLGEDKKPVRVTASAGGAGVVATSWRVLRVSTESLRPSTFDVPPREEHPTGGRVVQRHPVTVDEARRALGGVAVWLGPRLDGLELRRIEAHALQRQFASGRTARRDGIELSYRGRGSRFAKLRQTRQPDPAYGYVEGRYTFAFAPIPPAGKAAISAPGNARAGAGGLWRAQLRFNGVFVTAVASDRDLLFRVIRGLRPIR